MAIVSEIVATTTFFFKNQRKQGKRVTAVGHGGRAIEGIIWEEAEGLGVYVFSTLLRNHGVRSCNHVNQGVRTLENQAQEVRVFYS